MAELTGTLIAHRKRLSEIAAVLVRNGLETWVTRESGLLDAAALRKLRDHVVRPGVESLSEGERLRNALTELGTTWIKFGQMLSLRPDVVGTDVAAELEQLQGAVPADAPGVAQRTVESELGESVADLYKTFDASRSRRARSRRCIGRHCTTGQRSRSRSCTTEPRSGCEKTSTSWRGSPTISKGKTRDSRSCARRSSSTSSPR